MTERLTVSEVLKNLIERPVETLLRRWNWKAAILSACVRGGIFFAVNLNAGLRAAIGAMLVESALYATIAGFYGAIVQSFRLARPAWLATMTVMALLPAINHSLEFVLHSLAGTAKIGAGILVSVVFSMVSAAFNLFAMRRGALIVGAGKQSLLADIRQMPQIIFDFAAVLPRLLWRIRRQPRVIHVNGGKGD